MRLAELQFVSLLKNLSGCLIITEGYKCTYIIVYKVKISISVMFFFYVRVDFKERLENFVRVLSYFVFSWLLITPLLYIVVLQIINEGIDVYWNLKVFCTFINKPKFYLNAQNSI